MGTPCEGRHWWWYGISAAVVKVAAPMGLHENATFFYASILLTMTRFINFI